MATLQNAGVHSPDTRTIPDQFALTYLLTMQRLARLTAPVSRTAVRMMSSGKDIKFGVDVSLRRCVVSRTAGDAALRPAPQVSRAIPPTAGGRSRLFDSESTCREPL